MVVNLVYPFHGFRWFAVSFSFLWSSAAHWHSWMPLASMLTNPPLTTNGRKPICTRQSGHGFTALAGYVVRWNNNKNENITNIIHLYGTLYFLRYLFHGIFLFWILINLRFSSVMPYSTRTSHVQITSSVWDDCSVFVCLFYSSF